MPNATRIPALTLFQWHRPDAAAPALSAPLNEGDTIGYFNVAPQDENGATITAPFLFGVRRADGYVETIYAPNGANGAGGLSATGLVRGIRLEGLDYTTGDTDLDVDHIAGEEVFCNITAILEAIVIAAIQGTLATGGSGFIIGTDADGTVTISRSTGAGTFVGWVRWNTTNDMSQFSNDGTTWTNFSDSVASTITDVSANDTTPGYLNDKIVVDTDTMTKTILNPGGNETLELAARGGLADIVDDVTTTATELNQALDGISGNVTASALNTLTGGGNADALHSHNNPTISLFASEAVTAGQSVALLPIEVEYYAQLTGANLALGDSNVRRRHAVGFVPSVTSNSLTTMLFRAAEAVNGATTLGNLTISIQTDTAGAPSGTPIANGTANVISQATQRTWNTTQANRTATWASPPTLTAGTTYWLVFEVAATDVTNYLNIDVNSAHDENYITFTRLTYNLDTTTWGTSTTNATPFFWFDNQPKLLGMGLVPTDANFGARTWNFVGFAAANISAGASGNIYYDIVPNLTLSAGRKYYLSTTSGAITTTPPSSFYAEGTEGSSHAYSIGRALSSTSLKIEKGLKKVIIREATEISSTTIRNYLTWFPVLMAKVSARGTGNNSSVTSAGYFLGSGGESSIYSAANNAAAHTYGSSTIASLDTSPNSSNDFVGDVSALTDVGFTYTVTEGGTATLLYFIEVEG